MGNEIFIDNKVCVKPLRSRLEAIQNYNHLKHQRDIEALQE